LSGDVTVYWAPGCHLCEPVKETARTVCTELGATLVEVDITGDELLEGRFRAELPVVMVDGRKAFKYFLDGAELAERIRRHRARA
jgi:glutaredoxin